MQFRPGVLDADRRRAISDAGGRFGLRLALVRAASVTARDGDTLEALRERLRAAPGVLRVEDDAPIAVAKDPNDPGFEQQYALAESADNDIDAPAAWNKLTSCAKVAVIDTGIQLNHPDLKQNLWTNGKETNNGLDDDGNGYIDDVNGVDIVTGRGSGEDENGHGTHVAGIIGARGNNGRGVSGLCWKVKIDQRAHHGRRRPRLPLPAGRRASSTPCARARRSSTARSAVRTARTCCATRSPRRAGRAR